MGLIRQMKSLPRRVVFIDDKAKNVKSVEDALESTTIPHFSLRYGAADGWVKAFEPRIAEVEWRYFQQTQRFLSDEEAANRRCGERAFALRAFAMRNGGSFFQPRSACESSKGMDVSGFDGAGGPNGASHRP